MERFTELQFAAEVGVRIVLEGMKPGAAQLHIGVTPVENPDGQTSQTITVNVREG
jgi:hypothetical protein